MTDVVVGNSLLAGTGLLFVYYTFWVIILPFVDEDQTYIHCWFPDPVLALGLPLLAGAIGLTCIGLFIAVVFIRAGYKMKSS